MLWSVTKPQNSGLYWLDEVHKHFYTQLFEHSDFMACFDTSFHPVLAASQNTRERFKDVYDLFESLDVPLQSSFQDIYQNQLAYQNYFSDSTVPISRAPEELNDLWEASKKLGGYLYSSTLGLACFEAVSVDESSMDQHYQEYKDLNGNVCCFCGTEEMMEEREITADDGQKQWRASYDHYLAKKHYPFLAVDFDNLIPCCHLCNEKAKGEIDVLEESGIRTLAFDPFRDLNAVRLVTKYQQAGLKNIMTIEIEVTGCDLQAKGNTWNNTFKVLSRINKRLVKFDNSWLAPTLNGCNEPNEARQALQNEAQRSHSQMKHEREGYFKSLCFLEILTKTDEDLFALIQAVEKIYTPRHLN